MNAADLAARLARVRPDAEVTCKGWPVVGVREAGTMVELEVLVDDMPEDVAE